MRIQDTDYSPDTSVTSTSTSNEYPRNHVLVHHLHCCGIKELKGISYVTPKDAIQDFCFQRTAPDVIADGYTGTHQSQMVRDILVRQKFGCAFVIFTHASPKGPMSGSYGENLKAYIIEQKLGNVTIAGKERNPNSGNIVTVYLWAVNHDALFSWWEKNPMSELDRKNLFDAFTVWKKSRQI